MEATTQPVIEKLSGMGVEALQEVGSWVKGLKDFALDQAPALCQEIVRYGLVKYIVCFVVSLILFVVGIWLWKKSWNLGDVEAKKARESGDVAEARACENFAFAGMLFSVFAFILGVSTGLYNLFCVFSIWFCPRLYIIEYIKSAVGK